MRISKLYKKMNPIHYIILFFVILALGIIFIYRNNSTIEGAKPRAKPPKPAKPAGNPPPSTGDTPPPPTGDTPPSTGETPPPPTGETPPPGDPVPTGDTPPPTGDAPPTGDPAPTMSGNAVPQTNEKKQYSINEKVLVPFLDDSGNRVEEAVIITAVKGNDVYDAKHDTPEGEMEEDLTIPQP